MDSTELVFSMAIAVLFPFFFSKLANKISGYNEVSEMCDKLAPRLYSVNLNLNKDNDNSEYDKCYKEREEKLKDAEFHKHLVLIAVALIGLVLSAVIQTKSTKLGVGIGSIITLVIALFLYWHRYNETSKLVVLGVSLLFVMYFSVRLYKIQNAADIFTVEFGTK